MRHRLWPRPLALLIALLLPLACAQTQVPPLRRNAFTPDDEDERQLWNQAAELDQALAERDLVYQDPDLQAYLDGVVQQLQPHLGAQGVPVHVAVLRDPFLNASALPNGTLYVHMGLLAAMDNEAQLATVLGHELSHYVGRHALRERRMHENRESVATAIITVLAITAAGFSGSPNVAAELMQLGGKVGENIVANQVSGYSRDLERAADQAGIEAMIAAGYDPREAPTVFVRLQEEAAEENMPEPYFFGSHPKLEERIEAYRELLRTRGTEGGRVEADAYRDAVSRLLLDDAAIDLALGREAHARRTIDRHLAHRPESAGGYFMLGEARRRAHDAAGAEAAYTAAVGYDPTHAGAHRELGLLYRSQGRDGQARLALSHYLTLAPAARDAPLIRAYVDELDPARAAVR